MALTKSQVVEAVFYNQPISVDDLGHVLRVQRRTNHIPLVKALIEEGALTHVPTLDGPRVLSVGPHGSEYLGSGSKADA